LSKGQNTWKILNVKLPYATFDIGSFEINNNEIILLGGFNDGALDKVLNFKVYPGQAEGEIQVSQSSKLAEKDFFVVNGVTIKFSGDQN
jgi:N-acetylneuraminic acid mutarotase